MCEHKNLRTVGDRLYCKDCKTELPLEFLYKGQEEAPEEVIEAPAEAPEEVKAEEVKAEEVITEPVQEEQEAGQNAPVSEEQSNPAPKKEKAKTGRKTAKKEV